MTFVLPPEGSMDRDPSGDPVVPDLDSCMFHQFLGWEWGKQSSLRGLYDQDLRKKKKGRFWFGREMEEL